MSDHRPLTAFVQTTTAMFGCISSHEHFIVCVCGAFVPVHHKRAVQDFQEKHAQAGLT